MLLKVMKLRVFVCLSLKKCVTFLKKEYLQSQKGLWLSPSQRNFESREQHKLCNSTHKIGSAARTFIYESVGVCNVHARGCPKNCQDKNFQEFPGILEIFPRQYWVLNLKSIPRQYKKIFSRQESWFFLKQIWSQIKRLFTHIYFQIWRYLPKDCLKFQFFGILSIFTIKIWIFLFSVT